jgi:coenzyme Q-binding protein COQ10
MPNFQQVKILPYAAQELFKLVLDVQSYPEFLPWCKAARIISESDDHIIAELVIQAKGFSDKYQSKITPKIISEDIYSIQVEAISGPFKYLNNLWLFSKQGNSTKIEFSIKFEMKFTLLNKLIELFFADATSKIIDAFEKRAITQLTKKT